MQPISISEFIEDVEKTFNELNTSLDKLDAPSSLSMDNMNVSNRQYINKVVNLVALNHMGEKKKRKKINCADELKNELGLTEDQHTVLRSMQIHCPYIIDDLVSQYKVYNSLFGESLSVSLPDIKIPVEYYRRGNPSEPIPSDGTMFVVQITFSNRSMFVPIDFTILKMVMSILSQLDYPTDSEFLLYVDGVCYVPSTSNKLIIALDAREASLAKSLVSWLSQFPSYIEGSVQCRNASQIALKNISTFSFFK